MSFHLECRTLQGHWHTTPSYTDTQPASGVPLLAENAFWHSIVSIRDHERISADEFRHPTGRKRRAGP